VSDSSAPPYARIVGELRARIERGQLAPGDRVPSTRQIMKRWGVAMATATKVLNALGREGLVRAVPGVGTVVAGAPAGARSATPRARASPASEGPVVERIAAAAIVIADAEGLSAVSMRRVASELGVAPMSLYRHVTDKDELLLRMMESALREVTLPADGDVSGWRDRLELAARRLWAIFRRHPWLPAAMSITRPQPITSGLAYTEWVLATLDREGLDAATALTANITLFNYVRGVAINLELEAEAEASSGVSTGEWHDAQEPALRGLLSLGSFPTFERIVATDYEFDLDAIFEFGLQRMLDGLAPLLTAARRRAPHRGSPRARRRH
jgi:DNA-binding transcriptional regulator YhcF (GntR family)